MRIESLAGLVVGLIVWQGMSGLRAASAAEFPLQRSSDEERQAFERAKDRLLSRAAAPVPLLSESDESWFWRVAARMEPLLTAYEYSGDQAFIDAFVPIMDQVLSQRYAHPMQPDVWSGWWHYDDPNHMHFMPIHAAIMYYTPALRCIRAVRADAALKARYGDKVEAWFKDITEVSIPAWDKRGIWHDLGDQGGWYTHTTHYPDKATGEIVQRTDTYQGSSLAYNKVHALIQSFCLLYRMTGDDWYRRRIEQCERFFRSHWRIDDSHVEWNYRDFSGPWDYVNGVDGRTKTGYFVHPKDGYYRADVEAIVDCYNVGIVFTKADIERLVQTNVEFMWLDDESNPQFRKINGTYDAEAQYGKGYLWTSLAQFSPRVRELWKAQSGGRRSSTGYLIAVSEPVSWEPAYVREIRRDP